MEIRNILGVGHKLTKLRLKQERSITWIAKKLGISTQYMSDIEKGRIPSDAIIRSIAVLYGIPENDLFRQYEKTPLLAREELDENTVLQDILIEIRERVPLEHKDELYEYVKGSCREYITMRNWRKDF